MELVVGLFRGNAVLGFGPLASSPFASTPLTRYASRFDESAYQKELIHFSCPARKLIEALKSQPRLIASIDPYIFEELVAELLFDEGYKVELTKKTRDGGRDIIAIRREGVDIRLLVECKRTPKVGVGIVRELRGVLEDDQATKAILATTGFLSEDASSFVNRHMWRLEARDYDAICAWIAKYGTEGT